MANKDFTDDQLEKARARGELRRRILAQSEMLSADEFRRRIKETFVDRLPESLRALVLEDDEGTLWFPDWQIDLAGLGRVLAVLEELLPARWQLKFSNGSGNQP